MYGDEKPLQPTTPDAWVTLEMSRLMEANRVEDSQNERIAEIRQRNDEERGARTKQP